MKILAPTLFNNKGLNDHMIPHDWIMSHGLMMMSDCMLRPHERLMNISDSLDIP